MPKLTLDAAGLAKLGDLTQTAEVFDELGTRRAVTLPPFIYEGLKRTPAIGPFRPEEIDAAFRATDPGRPLEEILAELRA